LQLDAIVQNPCISSSALITLKSESKKHTQAVQDDPTLRAYLVQRFTKLRTPRSRDDPRLWKEIIEAILPRGFGRGSGSLDAAVFTMNPLPARTGDAWMQVGAVTPATIAARVVVGRSTPSTGLCTAAPQCIQHTGISPRQQSRRWSARLATLQLIKINKRVR
jgi:hypothetical protein